MNASIKTSNFQTIRRFAKELRFDNANRFAGLYISTNGSLR